jgi:hypothetical protein
MHRIACGPEGLDSALARLAFVEVETPEDLVERVMAALGHADDAERFALLRSALRTPASVWQTARRQTEQAAGRLAEWDRLRWGAVASSAVILGVVAIGLEARHLSRLREERA